MVMGFPNTNTLATMSCISSNNILEREKGGEEERGRGEGEGKEEGKGRILITALKLPATVMVKAESTEDTMNEE